MAAVMGETARCGAAAPHGARLAVHTPGIRVVCHRSGIRRRFYTARGYSAGRSFRSGFRVDGSSRRMQFTTNSLGMDQGDVISAPTEEEIQLFVEIIKIAGKAAGPGNTAARLPSEVEDETNPALREFRTSEERFDLTCSVAKAAALPLGLDVTDFLNGELSPGAVPSTEGLSEEHVFAFTEITKLTSQVVESMRQGYFSPLTRAKSVFASSNDMTEEQRNALLRQFALGAGNAAGPAGAAALADFGITV